MQASVLQVVGDGRLQPFILCQLYQQCKLFLPYYYLVQSTYCCFAPVRMNSEVGLPYLNRMNDNIFGGYLQLRRKLFWVIRFVKIENGILSYSEDKKSTHTKFVASLHNAHFTEHVNGEGVITLALHTSAGLVSFSFTKKQQKRHAQFKEALNNALSGRERLSNLKSSENPGEERVQQEPVQILNDSLVVSWAKDSPEIDKKIQQLKACFSKTTLCKAHRKMRVMVPEETVELPAHEAQPLRKMLKIVYGRIGAVYTITLILTLGLLLTMFVSALTSHFGILPALVGMVVTGLLLRRGYGVATFQPPKTWNRYQTVFRLNYSLLQALVVLRSKDSEWRYSKGSFNQSLLHKQGQFQVYEASSHGNRLFQLARCPNNAEELQVVMFSEGIDKDFEILYLLEQRLAYCRSDPSSEFNKIITSQVPVSRVHYEKDETLKAEQARKSVDLAGRSSASEKKKEDPMEKEVVSMIERYRQVYGLKYGLLGQEEGVERGSIVTERGLMATKAEGLCRLPFEDVFKQLIDPELMKQYDSMLVSITHIETLSESCEVKHMKYKGIFPVASRDFVNCFVSRLQGNQAFIICKSIERPDYRPDSGAVRASLHIGGFYLQRVEEGTRIAYLQEADLNGNIPGPIKNQVAKMQTQTTGKVIRLLEERVKQGR